MSPTYSAQRSADNNENLSTSHQMSPHAAISTTSPISVLGEGRKRKRSRIEMRQEAPTDFVTRGLINVEQAGAFFDSFFRGCDRFVPVFDPAHDTFESVRLRSSFLFDAICSTGCTVSGNSTQLPHLLSFELKKLVNQFVMLQQNKNLETVQALLVAACYSAERSLLLSFAARLAVEIELPNAYDVLIATFPSTESAMVDRAHLVRCSRTWFQLLVLENMLQVDAGKLPTFSSRGSVRRCRVMLQQPDSTPLDLRMLSQLELNQLRTKTHKRLARCDGGGDDEVLDEVSDARIDIHLWFNDWRSYMETAGNAAVERPLLLVNLRVQRHWCEAMVYFRALKCLGTENVEAMTPAGKQLLVMAKNSLKSHLATTLEEPNHYLPNLRYAMDFVWAKCAFCFLLVLKLTRLLPDSPEDNYRLLSDGNRLFTQLSSIGTSAGSSTSRLYVQVLGISLDKFSRALEQHNGGMSSSSNPMFFWESADANLELQSFVPEQFVFEWNFPGLTLFSSPTAWQDFFDDFLLGYPAEPGGSAIGEG